MRDFTAARDWERFHDVKSLTLALTGEVGEVAELVQWLPVKAEVDGAYGSGSVSSWRTSCSIWSGWPMSPASTSAPLP